MLTVDNRLFDNTSNEHFVGILECGAQRWSVTSILSDEPREHACRCVQLLDSTQTRLAATVGVSSMEASVHATWWLDHNGVLLAVTKGPSYLADSPNVYYLTRFACVCVVGGANSPPLPSRISLGTELNLTMWKCPPESNKAVLSDGLWLR